MCVCVYIICVWNRGREGERESNMFTHTERGKLHFDDVSLPPLVVFETAWQNEPNCIPHHVAESALCIEYKELYIFTCLLMNSLTVSCQLELSSCSSLECHCSPPTLAGSNKTNPCMNKKRCKK